MKRGLLVLALAFLAGSVGAETRTEYYALLFEGRKIGHLVRNTTERADGVAVEELSRLRMERLGNDVPILSRRLVETSTDGRLRRFEIQQTSGPNTLRMLGEMEADGRLRVEIRTDAGVQHRRLEIPADAVAGYGEVLARRRLGLTPGGSGSFRSFDPEGQEGT